MAKEYTAQFQPQFVVDGKRVPAPADGPDVWDCSAGVRDFVLPDGTLDKPFKLKNGRYLDTEGLLRADASAPEWVYKWVGPCEVWVTVTEVADPVRPVPVEPAPNPDPPQSQSQPRKRGRPKGRKDVGPRVPRDTSRVRKFVPVLVGTLPVRRRAKADPPWLAFVRSNSGNGWCEIAAFRNKNSCVSSCSRLRRSYGPHGFLFAHRPSDDGTTVVLYARHDRPAPPS